MTRPNILIMMTDHQRGDTVLPEHPCRTPNLDAFSRDGITFSQTFCSAPHCCPSRATFMTGLYPSRHGVWNNVCNDQAISRGLKPGVRCWSEDLNAAGYRMTYSGKWHVSSEEMPKDRGWQEEHRISGYRKNEHGAAWSHYRKLAEQPEDTARGEGEILRPGWGKVRFYGTWDKQAEVETTDDFTIDEGIAALPRLAASGKPWCLFLGCTMPHDPYHVPRQYLDRYRLEDVQLPPNYNAPADGKPAIVRRLQRQIWGQLTPREVREAIRHYWALCTYLDDLFGKVLRALDATGQAENTLVLYCSDHGDYAGEHGLFAKGIPCYRGAYHVPAVVRWPAGIRNPGRTVDEFVSLADFAPTFTQLAGKQPDPTLTGKSLVPFLDGEQPDTWRDEIHTQCNGVELWYTQRSVSTRDFKYIYNGFDEDELYDLRNDPHETVNLAVEPGHTSVKREMLKRLWRFAERESDSAACSYITVGLAPFGPATAFRTSDT